MATHSPEDLSALDEPDDWVSLFLNDVPEDQIIQPEVPDLTGPASAATSEQSRFEHEPRVTGTRTSTGPQSSRIDDLSLPSLDDLLADSSDTDPEGLFSGFKGVSNNNLDTFSRNDLARVQCNCTGIHSCCPEPQSSSDNEQSSTAPHHVALSPASTPLPKQQQHSANTQGRSAAAHLSPPQSTLPAAPAQAAPLNLAGLTAAQVASAVGFTGQLGSTQQPAAATSRQQPVSSSFVKSPARSHRKRTRDLDPSSAPQTTPAVVAGNNLEHLSPPADADALPSSNSAGHSAAGIDTARSGSPDINSSIAGTSGQEGKQHSSSQDSAQPDDEQKRQARMQRNRESAHQSRQRKRMQISEVEERCEQLKQHNSQLNELVGRLTAENIGLKQQLVGICHQTGVPLPPPPASAVMPFGFGHMGMPMMPAPKVPIQRMPAARPAPAHQLPTAQPQPGQQAAGQAGPYQPATNSNAQPNAQPGVYQPVGNSKSQSAQPQRARKRVKQAAGAGTVLLALFSFVVLMGPLGPLQGFAPAAQQQHVQAGGAGAVNGALHGAGRVLMSLPSGSEHAPSNLNNSQLQSLSLGQSGHLPARLNDDHLQLPHDGRHVPHDVMSLMEGSAENDVALPVQRSVDVTLHVQEWWSSGADNASYDNSKSIMLRPSDKIAEQEALQGLKDLAPFALYHSYWEQGITPAPLPVVMGSWQQALPGSDLDSEQSKSLSGFVGPSMCQQVFQSTAANDSPMQATQRAQRHLAAGTSMRGSGSIALPPVQEVGYEQGRDIPPKKARKTTIGCGEDDPGVVVSVMLPSKTEGSDTEYTSLDQLYIVVLTPGVKYSTYSCLLPKPILV